MLLRCLGLLIAVAFLGTGAWAYDPKKVEVTGHELPKELESVGADDHLGQVIDLTVPFTDDKGQVGPLSRFFHRDRPVLLAMVYYSCPSLCNYHLNGLTETMKQLKWSAGNEFDVVAISMLSTETPELASAKKHNYLQVYGRGGADQGWHFLVGGKDEIQTIATQLGFRFKWLEDKQQFAHASVTYVMTPEGKISRQINGIQPDVQTLRMSLLEAGRGKIGSIVDQALMFCFHFDPQKNKYTLYAWNIMRIGAIVMVLLLAVILIPLWRREQMHNRTRI